MKDETLIKYVKELGYHGSMREAHVSAATLVIKLHKITPYESKIENNKYEWFEIQKYVKLKVVVGNELENMDY